MILDPTNKAGDKWLLNFPDFNSKSHSWQFASSLVCFHNLFSSRRENCLILIQGCCHPIRSKYSCHKASLRYCSHSSFLTVFGLLSFGTSELIRLNVLVRCLGEARARASIDLACKGEGETTTVAYWPQPVTPAINADLQSHSRRMDRMNESNSSNEEQY